MKRSCDSNCARFEISPLTVVPAQAGTQKCLLIQAALFYLNVTGFPPARE
jgi:hypothetical protein